MILTILMHLMVIFAPRNRFPTSLGSYEASPPPFSDLRRFGYSTARLVHAWAKIQVGKDLSRIVDNEVACAESVSRILLAIDTSLLPGVITGTATLDGVLSKSPRFTRVTIPSPGCVIISPTGAGKGTMRGHTGIVGDKGVVYSNTSATGRWAQNFTTASWWNRYAKQGGFPIKYYKINN